MSHGEEIKRGDRFSFGENWYRFLSVLDDRQIAAAETSLCKMLGVASLEGKNVLGIGSGSGLFSFAARRLGVRVHSFDCDLRPLFVLESSSIVTSRMMLLGLLMRALCHWI